ncbi:ubiquitin-protein ligase [Heterostelium album PN500]|uniref:Ubiquitin-protein ligase n=1 Tax=Heterostelium pallidum (strain ATCC 26659 / Pp 5 / PN500) TaxID=670386 RepID=D3BIT7_HETP5|nr:ubiquitin-protein ligase [Heterostelium album PN500]EFA78711.1 ubiquitin-protein ligase [Heterostelium album PN500]|eukprot:XP_020430835.1 ubiquitin-protein ligase [Heterostelium album PN500]
MKRLSIALLKCDKFVPELQSKFGDIDVQFTNLLKKNKLATVDLSVYEVTDSKFPKWDDVVTNKYNGFIISGSRHSVNDNVEWTNALKDYVRMLDTNNIKTVGVCFGHQMIASALGGTVSGNPKGWQVSDRDYLINPTILTGYGLLPGAKETELVVDIMCMNKEMVTQKPKDLICYGGNEICANQGMINSNFLTFQGHPEYTPELIKEVLNLRKGIIPDDVIAEGIKRANESQIDYEWYSNLIINGWCRDTENNLRLKSIADSLMPSVEYFNDSFASNFDYLFFYGCSLEMNLQKYIITTQKPYSKIFWPIRCNDKKSGYLIGWNTRSFVACVIDIISDISLQDLEIILKELNNDKRMASCPVGQPRVLGEWCNNSLTTTSTTTTTTTTTDSNSSSSLGGGPNNLHDVDFWISMERSVGSGHPCLKKIYCNEYKFQTSSQIVLYDDTSPYYYTSTPISLVPTIAGDSNSNTINKHSTSTSSKTTSNSVFSPVATSTPTTTNSSTSSPSSLSSTSTTSTKLKPNTSDLESTFKQINCSNDIKTILNETIEKYYRSTNNNRNPLPSLLSIDSKPNSRSLFSNSFITLRKRKNSLKQSNDNNSSSKDNDSSIDNNNNNNNNIDDNSNNNNNNSSNIKQDKDNNNNNNNNSIKEKSKRVICAPLYLLIIILRLFEKILLSVLNMDAPFLKNKKLKDLTTLGSTLDSRIDEIKLLINQHHHVEEKKYWLNNNQDRALLIEYDLIINLNRNNIVITTTIAPHGVILLKIVCMSGVFGVSVLISIIIDLFSIFTLHISVFYSVSARFYLLQLMLLKSLWNLFRGVKYNPLRKRTDSCDFDQYQLLLGTLLFTLIFFLFPTTAVYYFFFATFKSSLTVVMALFSLLLHLLKTFPLFGMLVYFIDQKYLPNGVTFTVKNNENTKKQQATLTTTTITNLDQLQTPTITSGGGSNSSGNVNKPSSPLLHGQTTTTTTPSGLQSPLHQRTQSGNLDLLPSLQQQQQQQQQQQYMLSPKTGLGHRRNQSLSSSTSSPIGPRVKHQSKKRKMSGKVDEYLAQLIDMGFDPEVSRLAVEQTQCASLERAIEFIYSLSNSGAVPDTTPLGRSNTPTTLPTNNYVTSSSNLSRQNSATPTKKIRTSMRDSNEYVDSDDEYYQDVDDYQFDEPVIEAMTTSNTVVQASEIIANALVEIQRIESVTETSPCAATLMLLKYQWNGNKLLEQYYENPDKVKRLAGVPEKEEYTALQSTKEDCSVCCDTMDKKNTCYLSCKHYCGVIVSDRFIQEVVPKAYPKYLERLAQTYVDKNPNMRWCPTANCGNALKADSQAESVAQCSCGFRMCFKCNQESHVPANCDQIKLWKKKNQDDSETANWIQSHTQDCPKCHSSIEKNGGCNHMTCKKCTHEFCWVCMGNWRGHSSCNSFKKEDNSNKSDSKRALERYLFYFHRYNTHEQSKKFETKLRQDAMNTIFALQNNKDKRWIDVKFIESSTETLIQCRRTLKYTYVFGFYLPEGAEKNLFEYLQSDLERTTEKLSGLLEKGENQNVMELKEITNLASTKLNHLLDGVEEGLTSGGKKTIR